MALLSDAEKAKLKEEQGIYVKEKCDQCAGPILECSYLKKDGRVLCPVCAKGKDLVQANIKGETEIMAKKVAAKAEKKENGGTKKIFGIILPGTAIADLAEFLQDGKVHKLKETLGAIAPKHKADKMGRLRQLARYGRNRKLWAIKIDEEDETVQLVMGEKAAEKLVEQAKEAKAEKKEKKKANGKADDDDDQVTSKQQLSVQKLIRRVLKSKDDLTESKLVELMKEDHELDGKRVQAALAAEIKAGGITKEKGVLSLA